MPLRRNSLHNVQRYKHTILGDLTKETSSEGHLRFAPSACSFGKMVATALRKAHSFSAGLVCNPLERFPLTIIGRDCCSAPRPTSRPVRAAPELHGPREHITLLESILNHKEKIGTLTHIWPCERAQVCDSNRKLPQTKLVILFSSEMVGNGNESLFSSGVPTPQFTANLGTHLTRCRTRTPVPTRSGEQLLQLPQQNPALV